MASSELSQAQDSLMAYIDLMASAPAAWRSSGSLLLVQLLHDHGLSQQAAEIVQQLIRVAQEDADEHTLRAAMVGWSVGFLWY